MGFSATRVIDIETIIYSFHYEISYVSGLSLQNASHN